MKILLVLGSINQGGAEFQLLCLAKLLQSRNQDIEVLALTDYRYYLPFIVENHIKYSCVSNKGHAFYRLLKAVKQINSKKPDLVISYIRKVSQVVLISRVLSGFRFKLIISERTSLIKPWNDLFYFSLALLANKLTVNSIPKYEYIRKKFPHIKERTVFIPNIIDIEKYSTIRRNKPEAGITHISYVGRISPEKNLVNLLKAIHMVVVKGIKVRLSLIGEANNRSYLAEVNQMISELDLAKYVKYEGPSDNIFRVYENTDLLCLVSIYEGFSNVLSEAISCGIPVIASNIPENKYLVEDSINGFLVDPNSILSISAGIERFLTLSSGEIDAISTNNKQKAVNIFNEELIYSKYKALIHPK